MNSKAGQLTSPFWQPPSDNRWIYLHGNSKGMYALPQAGIIAQELLADRLTKHGYMQSKIIPGFWKQATKPICFTLVVNNFAVKYTREQDAEHLISALKKEYDITINQTTIKYIRLTIKWDLKN